MKKASVLVMLTLLFAIVAAVNVNAFCLFELCLFEEEKAENITYSFRQWISIENENQLCAFNQPGSCKVKFSLKNPSAENITVPCDLFEFRNEKGYAKGEVYYERSYTLKQVKDERVIDRECPITLRPNESRNFTVDYPTSPFGKNYYEILFNNYAFDPWLNGTLWQDMFVNDSFINYSRSTFISVSGGAASPNATTTTLNLNFNGTPYNTSIPNMTAANAPSPLVAWSSTFLADPAERAAWHMFNSLTSTSDGFWISAAGAAPPAWIGIDLGVGKAKAFNNYTLVCPTDTGETDRCFKNWTIQASSDNATWVVLHNPAEQTGWALDEGRSFNFTNAVAYRYWMINASSNNGDATFYAAGFLAMRVSNVTSTTANYTNATLYSTVINESTKFYRGKVDVNVTLPVGTNISFKVCDGTYSNCVNVQQGVVTALNGITGVTYVANFTTTNTSAGPSLDELNLTLTPSQLSIIDFVNPTPANNAGVARNWTYINVSGSQGVTVDTFVFNWNGTNVSLAGLVLDLHFNGNTGDYSGSNNNGQVNNGANCSTAVIGKFGGACSFDGVNDFVRIPNTPSMNFSNNTEQTLMAWYYLRQTTGGNMYILTQDNWKAGFAFNLAINKLSYSIGQVVNGCERVDSPDTFPVTTGQWIHVSGVFNRTNSTLYINGLPVATTNCSIGFSDGLPNAVADSNTVDWTLGAHTGGGQGLNGFVDEAKIFTRALTPQALKAIYQSEFGKYNDTNMWFMNQTMLVDGAYTYYAWINTTTTDSNQTATRTVTIDTILPKIELTTPTVANMSTISATTLINVSLTELNNQTIIISLDSVNYSNGAVNLTIVGNSQFYFHKNFSSLTEGNHTFYAWSNDTANNVNQTETRTFTVDTSAPTVVTSVYANYSTGNASSNSSWNTTNITVYFKFTEPSISTCSLYSNATGAWLLNRTINYSDILTGQNFSQVTLHDSHYMVNVTCNDSMGLENSNATNYVFAMDRIPPRINLSSPANNTWVNRTNIVFNWTVHETGFDAGITGNSKACIVINNETGSMAEDTAFTYTSLNYNGHNASYKAKDNNAANQGSTLWNVECVDNAGNVARNNTNFIVNVDSLLPNISIISPLNNSLNQSSSVRIVYTVIDNSLDTCSIYSNMTGSWQLNQSAINASGHNFTLTFQDGSYRLNISCNDSAGNVGTPNPNPFFVVNVDSQFPLFSQNYTNFSQLKINESGSLTLVIEEDNVAWAWLETNITGTLANISYANLQGSNVNVTLNLTPARLTRNNTFTYRAYFNDSTGRINSTDLYTTTINASSLNATIFFPENMSTISTRYIRVNYTALSLDADAMNCTLVVDGDYHNTTTGVVSGGDKSQNLTSELLSEKSHLAHINCSAYVPQRITFTTPPINLTINTSTTQIQHLTIVGNTTGNGLRTNFSCGEKTGLPMATGNVTQYFNPEGLAKFSAEQTPSISNSSTADIKTGSVGIEDCQVSPSLNFNVYFLGNYSLNISKYNVGSFNLTSQVGIKILPGVIVTNILLHNKSDNSWLEPDTFGTITTDLNMFSVSYEGEAAREFFVNDKNASFAFGINKNGAIFGTDFKEAYLGLQQLQIVLVPSLNVSFKDITNNVTILNFSVSVYNTTTGFSYDTSTQSGHAMVSLDHGQGLYYVRVGGQGYGNVTDTITVSNLTDQITLYSNPVNSLNIVFYDEERNVRVTDLHPNKSVTFELISDVFAANYSSSNSTILITNILSGSYEIRYKATDYTKRSYFVNFDNSTFADKKLYLLNDSLDTIIVATLQDEVGNRLEGGVFSMKRLYVTNNTYEVVEMGKTNFEGQAAFTAVVNTQEYKFSVDYQNRTYGSQNPAAKILSSTFTFTVKLQEDFFKSLREINKVFVNLSVDKPARVVNLEYKDPVNILSSMCLIVDHLRDSKKSEVCNTCSVNPQGNITCSVSNITGQFTARAIIHTRTNFSDYNRAVMSFSLEELQKIFAKTGLFISVMLIGLAGLIGGLVAGAAGMIIFSIIGLITTVLIPFTVINYASILGLAILGAITVYLINPRRGG